MSSGNNLVITNVAMETYLFTTVQPRYLDVIPANNKQIVVNGNKTLSALELKGGDVDHNNLIGGGDASIVGTQYGTAGTGENNGDANFSGKVDIFDLALVGGNYLLTSETAYGVGNNIWVP